MSNFIHGLSSAGFSSQMDDSVLAGQRGNETGLVPYVAANELHVGANVQGKIAVASVYLRAEVVHNGNRVAIRQQLATQMGSNEARSPSNQYLHLGSTS